MAAGAAPLSILCDVTRLVHRAHRPTPTGIDRVEAAYAHSLAGHADLDVAFVARRWDGFVRLPRAQTRGFIAALLRRWAVGDAPASAGRRSPAWSIDAATFALWCRYGTGLGAAAARRIPAPIFLKVSHDGLERGARYRRFKRRTGCRMVACLHDLIPVRFPEYVRPGAAAVHARRLRTLAELADLVIVNSSHTGADFAAWCGAEGLRPPPIRHVELAVDPVFAPAPAAAPGAPRHFLCVGTIEPRKNHLLLLNVWRDLAQRLGAAAPKLVIVGRAGWENENVMDMLQRSPALRGCVTWRCGLSDAELVAEMHAAHALLAPSFAEGYGMPVAEALAAGTPVICADLPALREAGQNLPLYLDPVDGAAWRDAILAYAASGSPQRAAQAAALARFRPVRWDEHFRRLRGLLAAPAAGAPSAA